MATDKNILDCDRRRFFTAVMIELNRSVAKKLTGEYLGVFTGLGRNTTRAIKNNDGILFGTYPDYMYGYETNDWSNVKQDHENAKRYWLKMRGRKNSRWTGDRKHRPFIKDTIESPIVQEAIINRYIGEN